jgi:hypothetical protein
MAYKSIGASVGIAGGKQCYSIPADQEVIMDLLEEKRGREKGEIPHFEMRNVPFSLLCKSPPPLPRTRLTWLRHRANRKPLADVAVRVRASALRAPVCAGARGQLPYTETSFCY